jgi:hypothetical protein
LRINYQQYKTKNQVENSGKFGVGNRNTKESHATSRYSATGAAKRFNNIPLEIKQLLREKRKAKEMWHRTHFPTDKTRYITRAN